MEAGEVVGVRTRGEEKDGEGSAYSKCLISSFILAAVLLVGDVLTIWDSLVMGIGIVLGKILRS